MDSLSRKRAGAHNGIVHKECDWTHQIGEDWKGAEWIASPKALGESLSRLFLPEEVPEASNTESKWKKAMEKSMSALKPKRQSDVRYLAWTETCVMRRRRRM